jgi:peptidoglycan hydrolase-like protein with peptidoglycan-binding domain
MNITPTRALAVLCGAASILISATVVRAEGPPAPSTAPAVAGHLELVLQHAHGKHRFELTGERLVVRGVLSPYVADQRVTVRFYRRGRLLVKRTVNVLSLDNGSGQFHIGYSSSKPGTVTVTAEHVATPQMDVFSARSAAVRYLSADLGEGASGPAVRLLQSELAGLHYSVSGSGVFDQATGRAVVAYRKMTGLSRVSNTSSRVFELLQRDAGSFHVRYPGDGRHVEADLTRQVLAEIEPRGHVRRIYTISSGKPSTPTVLGRFQVYEKTPGTNAKGMVDANYFIRGYAIHGYAEVPTYAASHGCLRVPVPDAASIYSWVQLGTPVDVYYEDGRASTAVRDDAGP